MAIPVAAVLGTVGGGMIAGGLAGSLFGKKKTQPIDISQQLAQVRDLYSRNRGLNEQLRQDLAPLTEQYRTGLTGAREEARGRLETGSQKFLGEQQKLSDQARENLRASLYGRTFQGLPDTLRAVREAAAAGSGIDSGAYQQAVQNVGAQTAAQLVQGERDVELEGVRGMQQAQRDVFNTFASLESKLTDSQLGELATVLDTGREDLVRQATTAMGLNQAETQAVIDLMNFQATGQLAAQSAADAQRQALYNSLISSGTNVLGSALAKKG